MAYALLGVAAFAVFLIVRAPASLLATAMERASHNTITIGAPAGTIWSGSGQLVARQTSESAVGLGQVTWTINPLWLLAGKIGLGITVSGGGTDVGGHVRAGFGSVTLEGVKGVFPARLVPYFYAPAELLGPDGRVEISVPHLRWSRKNGITGVAEIRWRDAASSLTMVRPLGDYRLSLEGQGGTAAIMLETIEGVLVLAGKGHYTSSPAMLKIAGTARAADRHGELEPLLGMMGPGKNTRNWSIRMP